MSATIDVEEVCTLLKCSRPVLMEELRTGGLPGLKFGQEWVIFRDALMQRLNERALMEATARRQTPKGPPPKPVKAGRRPPCLVPAGR